MFRESRIGLMWMAFVILMSLACSAQSEEVSKNNECDAAFTTFDGLPTQVLVGTDIVDSSSLNTSSQVLKSEYSAEMGGAKLTLYVTQTDKGRTVKRIYQEPGMIEVVRDYSPVCFLDGRLSADRLKGKIVDGGLILLEERPDVNGIPNNLWIYYRSK